LVTVRRWKRDLTVLEKTSNRKHSVDLHAGFNIATNSVK